MKPYVLVLYYSATGAVASLSTYIAKGVIQQGVEVRVRRIQPISGQADPEGPLFVTKEDLAGCSGLILGSPTRFGQMAAAVRAFWDRTGEAWYQGQLEGKPAAVFTASSSMHGGQESTLLGMMMPMIHHGMLIVGVPYSEEALHKTLDGGGPYGASTVTGDNKQKGVSAIEQTICQSLGSRVARITLQLQK